MAGQVYDWNVAETLDVDPSPIDGGVMAIEMPLTSDMKRAVGSSADMASAHDLATRPNPTGGATTISYMLPIDVSVTIAI